MAASNPSTKSLTHAQNAAEPSEVAGGASGTQDENTLLKAGASANPPQTAALLEETAALIEETAGTRSTSIEPVSAKRPLDESDASIKDVLPAAKRQAVAVAGAQFLD